MNIRRTIRHPFELALTRLGLAFVPLLSRRGVLGLATSLGTAAYYSTGHLRRVGFANLDLVYGGSLPARSKRSILLGAFRMFAQVILDTLWFSRHTRERLDRYVTFDRSFSALFRPAAQICVSAHLGNWEVLGQALALKGYPLASVAAPLANPGVDRLLNRLRAATGQTIVPQRGALKRLLHELRAGHKVALLLDQNTKPSRGGMFLDFFGLEVPVSTAPAALAWHTQSEICVGFAVPLPDGRYQAWLRDVIAPPSPSKPRDAAVAQLTERLLANVRDEIQRHPQNWLWMYKRWKYVAPGRRREEYPFYAKFLGPPETPGSN